MNAPPIFQKSLYATDVTFHNGNGPVGGMRESRTYYSSKHKLHEFKTDMSVLPNRIFIEVSLHARGGVSDIQIFKNNISFHTMAPSTKKCLTKMMSKARMIQFGH